MLSREQWELSSNIFELTDKLKTLTITDSLESSDELIDKLINELTKLKNSKGMPEENE